MDFKDIESWIGSYQFDATKYMCTIVDNANGIYVRFGLIGSVEFTLLIKPNGMLDGHRSKGISEQSSRFANDLINYLDS